MKYSSLHIRDIAAEFLCSITGFGQSVRSQQPTANYLWLVCWLSIRKTHHHFSYNYPLKIISAVLGANNIHKLAPVDLWQQSLIFSSNSMKFCQH